MVLASSAARAESWDTFIKRFFSDKQFRHARTATDVDYIAKRISEREDGPLLCDRLDGKKVLAGLDPSLAEPDVTIEVKQLDSARGLAMVYAAESDAYFEQLTFSQTKGRWILHRIDQGTTDFREDYVLRRPCEVQPRHWMGFEQTGKIIRDGRSR